MPDEELPQFDFGPQRDNPSQPAAEPTRQQPPVTPGFPPSHAPAGGGANKRKRGCIIAAVVVSVLMFLLLAVVVGVVIWAGTKAKDELDQNSGRIEDIFGNLTTTSTPLPNEPKLFSGRIDAQPRDRERNLGQGVDLSGYTATVTSAGFQQNISEFQQEGYVYLNVMITNRDTNTQSYNYYNWRLQTPNGEVLDPEFTNADGQLRTGDLVKGGTVSGKLFFEVGNSKGDFFVLYKPDLVNDDRGVWKVTL